MAGPTLWLTSSTLRKVSARTPPAHESPVAEFLRRLAPSESTSASRISPRTRQGEAASVTP